MKRIRALWAAPGSPALWEMAGVVVILLAATFFRVNLFESAPPGLQHDEIFKANFALDILDGGWPVFFDPNGGEEALFPYLAAASITLFGRSFFALRFVSLACGILSIALTYSLVRELFGRRVALLTAAAVAVSFWHVFDSRVALRPITLLVMGLASLHAFWMGLQRGRMWSFVLSGVFLGVSFYTYTSGFLVPLTIILFLIFYMLPFRRELLLQRWRGIVLAFTIALIILLPMAHHMYTHPVASTARARDLSDHINLLLAGQPGPILQDMVNVLGMFGLSGDPEWRYNLSGRPVFDLVTFALFCFGSVICLSRVRKPEYAFLIVWLGVNIVPSALTRNSPSTLRAIGALVPIYVLPFLTLDLAWERAGRRFGKMGTRALLVAVLLLLVCNATLTYRDYFHVWAQNAEVREIYRADLSEVATFLDQSVGDEMVCVSASFAADLDQQVLRFMLGEERLIRWFDGRQALVFPEPEPSRDVMYIFPATGPLRDELANRFFSDQVAAETVLDPHGEPAFVAYHIGYRDLSRMRSSKPAHQLAVDLEDRVRLVGYELPYAVQAGQDLPLYLYWSVAQPIRPDLLFSFFAHLVDTRGYVWDQVDALGYPVSSWIEGDLAIQVFDLAVPPDAPPLEYGAVLGMYDGVTGVRLTASGDAGALPDDVVPTEPFSVRRATSPPSVDELDIPRERNASFEDKLKLLGCDVGARAVERGDAVHISLYWQALVDQELDYAVSILLTDESGEVLEEILRDAVDGLYPTSLWSEGEVVRDRFDFGVDQSVPEGRHRLWVRLWDPNSQSYLRVVGSEDDRVRLGKVYVVAGQ